MNRQTLALRGSQLALVCATALIVLPKGFAAFGTLMIAITLLVPGTLATAWSECSHVLRWIGWLSVVVVGVTVVSMHFSGQGWREIDNVARLLLMPWCGLMAFALAPSRLWLWLGAISGVCIAFVFALWDVFAGVQRVGVGSNPIVFANAVLALLVLVVYCRPQERRLRVLLAIFVVLMLGVAAIVLSGSRGAVPGFGLMLLVAMIGSHGKKMWLRLGVTLAALASSFALTLTIPWLASRTRLGNVHSELQQYANGDVDTPIGARIEFLKLAARALHEHPWTGAGLDRFGLLVDQLPACRGQEPGICQMNHAHNDLAQWAATLGIPGLLMIVALYLLPLLVFVRIIRVNRLRAPIGPAWAGLMLVVVYILSGMTQSMFAHALTTTIYAVFVGLLLGLALHGSSVDAGRPDS